MLERTERITLRKISSHLKKLWSAKSRLAESVWRQWGSGWTKMDEALLHCAGGPLTEAVSYCSSSLQATGSLIHRVSPQHEETDWRVKYWNTQTFKTKPVNVPLARSCCVMSYLLVSMFLFILCADEIRDQFLVVVDQLKNQPYLWDLSKIKARSPVSAGFCPGSTWF